MCTHHYDSGRIVRKERLKNVDEGVLKNTSWDCDLPRLYESRLRCPQICCTVWAGNELSGMSPGTKSTISSDM